MITLYNAISKDGYIAQEDSSEDFIPDVLWDEFVSLCKRYDYLVIGRKTYETIQKYPSKEIKKLESFSINRIVITRNNSFKVKTEYTTVHSIEEILKLKGNILVSSGPTLNTFLLKGGFVDEVMLNIIPININKGIKAFDLKPDLIFVSQEDRSDGRKLCVYQIKKID